MFSEVPPAESLFSFLCGHSNIPSFTNLTLQPYPSLPRLSHCTRPKFLNFIEPLFPDLSPFSINIETKTLLEGTSRFSTDVQNEWLRRFFSLFRDLIPTTSLSTRTYCLIALISLIEFKSNSPWPSDNFDLFWEICKSFFTPDPLNSCNFIALSHISKALASYIKESDLLKTRIFKYLARGGPCIYNLLPFLAILERDGLSVWNFWINSDLFTVFFQLAVVELPIFDFVTYLIVNRTTPFNSNCPLEKTVFPQLFKWFQDDDRRPRILDILPTCLMNPKDSEVIPFAIQNISACLKDYAHLNRPLIGQFVGIIRGTFKISDRQILHQAVRETHLLLMLADLMEHFPEDFPVILDLFADLSVDPIFLQDCILCNDELFQKFDCLDQNLPVNFECLKRFLLGQGKGVLIKNFRAIPFFFHQAWDQSENEHKLTELFLELTQNPANIYEMDRVNTLGLVLDRLLIIQENEILRKGYLRIFHVIARTQFSPELLGKSIGVLKSPEFRFPHELLQIFAELVALEDSNAITSFFRFGQADEGQTTSPDLRLNSLFPVELIVSLSFRRLPVENPNFRLFLKLTGDSGNNLQFGLIAGVFTIQSGAQTKAGRLIEPGKWFQLEIIIKVLLINDEIVVRIENEEMKFNVPHLFSRVERHIRIGLGRDPEIPRRPSLPCDISTVKVHFGNSLIAEMNPTRVQQGKLLDIAPGLPAVDFTGNVTPFLSGFRNVFMFPNTLRNILPLLKIVNRKRSIDFEVGCSFVTKFFELLINLVKIGEDHIDCQLLFPVLSSFLTKLDGRFLEVSFVMSIVEFFEAFTSDVNRSELVETLYLNLDMIAQWPDKSKVLWFSVLERQAQNDLSSFQIPLPSLIGSILPFYDAPFIVKNAADSFLVNLIERRNDPDDLKIVAQFAIGTNVTEHKLHCVDLLTELIQRIPDFFTPDYRSVFLHLLEQCGAFHAFISFWRNGQIGISDSSLTYLAIAALKQGSVIVAQEWVNEIESILSVETFPLFVYLLVNLPDREISRTWIKSKFDRKLILGQYSFHWLVILFGHAYGFDNFTPWFEILICLTVDDLKNLFCYLDLYESQHSISFKSLKRELIAKMIEQSGISTEFGLPLEFLLRQMTFGKEGERLPIGKSVEHIFDVMNKIVSASCAIAIDFQNDSQLIEPLMCLLLAEPLQTVVIGSATIEAIVAAMFLALQVGDVSISTFERFLCNIKGSLIGLNRNAPRSIIETLIEEIRKRELPIEISDLERIGSQSEAVPLDFSAITTSLIPDIDAFQAKFCAHFEELLSEGKSSTIANDQDWFSAQTNKLLSLRSRRHRTRRVFLSMLGNCPGPWAKPNRDLHFKISDRISRTGRRVLMYVNDRFHSHVDASDARDNIFPPREVPIDSPLHLIPSCPMPPSAKCLFEAVDVIHIWLKSKPGRLAVLETGSIIFEGPDKRIHIPIKTIRFAFNRYHSHPKTTRQCEDKATEIFTTSNKSFVFIFLSTQLRTDFYRAIIQIWKIPASLPTKFNFFAELQKLCQSCCQNHEASWLAEKLKLTEHWKNYELTTFTFLYYINLLGDRSYRRIAHYPFYPWLIRNNRTIEIDLESNIYRDLSKPPVMLATDIYQERLNIYRESIHHPELADACCLAPEQPSSEGGLSPQFVRVEPFTTAHVIFQESGSKPRFDSRLTWSIPLEMEELHNSAGFLREQPGEYFTMPSMLVNENQFNLGSPGFQVSKDVNNGDVELPKWASNARQFTQTQRIALDSQQVSASIGQWIDLFFGIHRNSPEKGNAWPSWALPGGSDICGRGILFGMIPLQVFQEEIGHRGNPPIFERLDKQGRFSGNVIAIKKGFVICDDGIILEFLSGFGWKIDFRGMLFGISRVLKIVVFGSGRENCITIADLKNGNTRSLSHKTSLITCAAVIGGEYLLTGATDCAIRIYQLPGLSLMSESAFHGSRIISIGGNLDLGLVVSIDSDFFMVLETLFEPVSINWVSLPMDVNYRPKIEVFKSGTVAIGLRHQIKFFDARGLLQAEISVADGLEQIEKYYDIGDRELLIVADLERAWIVDLTIFEVIPAVKVSKHCPRACGLKKQRAILVSSFGNSYNVRSFTISTLVRPAKITSGSITSQDSTT
jgi:hypothetical protein